MKKTCVHRLLVLAAGAVASPGVLAHTGHEVTSLFNGLLHPLGLDHLLAMVAVGLWACAALPAGRRLAAPVAFMAALLAGAVAGLDGVAGAWVEPAIAASVVVLAGLLAVPTRIGMAAGLCLVALAGGLHGVAHGSELPPGGAFAGYAAGFLVTTAVLHGLGLALGRPLLAWRPVAWRLVSAALGLAGLALVLA